MIATNIMIDDAMLAVLDEPDASADIRINEFIIYLFFKFIHITIVCLKGSTVPQVIMSEYHIPASARATKRYMTIPLRKDRVCSVISW